MHPIHTTTTTATTATTTTATPSPTYRHVPQAPDPTSYPDEAHAPILHGHQPKRLVPRWDEDEIAGGDKGWGLGEHGLDANAPRPLAHHVLEFQGS